MPRLVPRQIFLDGNRRLDVVFFTSSLAKFLQAKLVFEAVGLSLAFRAHDDEPYHETYRGSKEDLLVAAIKELRKRDGTTGTLFFIEDTSIRIEALSETADVPGLAAKEWFAATTFPELDQRLRQADDRSASVSSSIALSIPGLDRPLYFHGTTYGRVADQPAQFDTDPLFPWLSPGNFSAWFIPDGASKTLSEMSFEESLEYDFRVRSLLQLIDRLEEYAAVLNAPSSIYSRRELVSKGPSIALDHIQDHLFPVEGMTILLIVGPPCAGKSTLGMFALQADKLHCQVVDASGIVRARREEFGEQDRDISDFARSLLREEGPDIIARMIARSYTSIAGKSSLIITGFRTIEEIQYFRRTFANVRIVSIEAPSRLRYERYVRRGTRTSITSYDGFIAHDNVQDSFGLLGVASVLADLRVKNIYTRDVYYRQCARVLGMNAADTPGIVAVSSRMDPEVSQLYRCLVVLRTAGRPMTTQEVEADFDPDHHVRYNNANKILKRYPQLALRQEGYGSNVRYHITQSGLAFLAAVDWLQLNG